MYLCLWTKTGGYGCKLTVPSNRPKISININDLCHFRVLTHNNTWGNVVLLRVDVVLWLIASSAVLFLLKLKLV